MNDVFALAKQAPLEEVIGRYRKLIRRGGHYLGLCPFHHDHHLGSFVVTPKGNDKSIWRCFSCGTGGDGVEFVAKIEHISRYEAAVRICEAFGYIQVGEIPLRHTAEKVLPEQEKRMEKTVRKLSEKRSPEELHQVYEAFWEAAYPLSPRFQKHLLEERDIPKGDLGYYFVYPGSHDAHFWNVFRKALAETTGITDPKEQDQRLLGVPGFFQTENGTVSFLSQGKAAIGYLTVGLNLQITGIQLRVMEPLQKGEPRYRFFSSGFADGSDGSNVMGCNCGFVEDVLFPESRWVGKAVAVTEGRFKAAALAKLGFFAVNMHSISNFRQAAEVCENVCEKYGAKLFVAVFDAEDNPAVLHSAEELAKRLKSAPVEFAVWDASYGKGFDDVMHAGNLSKVSRVSLETYRKRWKNEEQENRN